MSKFVLFQSWCCSFRLLVWYLLHTGRYPDMWLDLSEKFFWEQVVFSPFWYRFRLLPVYTVQGLAFFLSFLSKIFMRWMLSFWHEVTLILYFCCLQPSYLSDNRTLLVLGCLHEFWRSPPRNVPSLFSVFSVLTLPISRFWQYALFIFAGISSRLRILRCRQHLVCG